MAERTGGLRRFIPFTRERVSPEDRNAQTVRYIRQAAEEGLRVPYSVEKELVVPQALAVDGQAEILVFTHRSRMGEGWGSVAVPLNPDKKSTDPAVILGSISIDALSLEHAASITSEWIQNSTGSSAPADVRKHKDFPHLVGRYEENIHKVAPNTP